MNNSFWSTNYIQGGIDKAGSPVDCGSLEKSLEQHRNQYSIDARLNPDVSHEESRKPRASNEPVVPVSYQRYNTRYGNARTNAVRFARTLQVHEKKGTLLLRSCCYIYDQKSTLPCRDCCCSCSSSGTCTASRYCSGSFSIRVLLLPPLSLYESQGNWQLGTGNWTGTAQRRVTGSVCFKGNNVVSVAL